MELDYQAYERLFNTGDDEALVARFFARDTLSEMLAAAGFRVESVRTRKGTLMARAEKPG